VVQGLRTAINDLADGERLQRKYNFKINAA
jgi:hypothetical protein